MPNSGWFLTGESYILSREWESFVSEKWIKYLPDGFTIYFFLKTLLAQIISFSVVLIKDDECIARYDTALGSRIGTSWAEKVVRR